MRTFATLSLGAGLLVGGFLAVHAQTTAPIASAELETTGIVQAVDSAHEELVVRETDGNVVALQVSPDVPHLHFLKPGDRVLVRYVQPVALALEDPQASLPAPDTVQITSAKKPGTVALHTQTLTAWVDGVDRVNRIVTLRSPEGNRVQAKVGPEVTEFDHLKPGDQVVAQFTQALAFDIQKA